MRSITYDSIGNPKIYMGAEIKWFARQMQSYITDTLKITYKYDTDGLRTQKVVNGVVHEYYYVDGLLMHEKIGDENLLYYRYDQNGTVIAINRTRLSDGATGFLFPVTNSRGDVIELRSGTGALNAKYTYDSWGKLISITDANGNPVSEDSLAMLNSIRYRGYVYDHETGLYYLQSRYYDPETGRFLNADDVDFIGYSGEVLSYNMFAYCENNAVNCADYTGLFLSKLIFYYKRINEMLSLLKSFVVVEKDRKTINTKGTIRIYFYKLDLRKLTDCYNNDAGYFLTELTKYALQAFESMMGRPFLFDDYCVYEEIRVHLVAYLWSCGEVDTFPTKMFAYYLIQGVSFTDTVSRIYKATKSTDIYERDVYSETQSGLLGFNYYTHIRDCYKNTRSDPYYNVRTKKRSSKYIRSNWLYEILSPSK